MTRIPVLSVILLVTCAVGLSIAVADDIDVFLKKIKDPSADVRIKAIEDLCAG